MKGVVLDKRVLGLWLLLTSVERRMSYYQQVRALFMSKTGVGTDVH